MSTDKAKEFEKFLETEIFSRNIIPTQRELALMGIAYFSAKLIANEAALAVLKDHCERVEARANIHNSKKDVDKDGWIRYTVNKLNSWRTTWQQLRK